MGEPRTAVIDLGSNSFRLVVFTAADGWWTLTDEIFLAVRVGAGLDATGELGEKPMKRALEALGVFAHFLEATGIGARDVAAVATSAIRDASNQAAFLERVRAETGLEVRVISREEEAYYGYLAAVNSTTLADGVVLDLGGGSLQLVEVNSRHPGRFGLFDELAGAGLHPGDRWERELLWCACVLHDIGMSVGYDDHHKHSRYLILNAGLPGFAPREVALIAQGARYHRKGMPDFVELETLMEDGDDARLDRMAILLRLAEDLERSRDQSVHEAHVRSDDSAICLELDADGAASVERWAAQLEGELFDRAFDKQLRVEST